LHQIYNAALVSLGRKSLEHPLTLQVSAQGGVGNIVEHQFLINYYQMNGVGWGLPFLLVPEAVNIDDHTFNLLAYANEKDLYLSNTSPIGVPINSVYGNTKDIERDERIKAGKLGSTCVSHFLKLFNKEFSDKPICLASRQYQNAKIEELKAKQLADELLYQKQYNKITEKSCLCTGLVMTAYTENDILKPSDSKDISVCPKPNMAYFSKKSTLQEMLGHIYGKTNLLNDTYRPNMFMKELGVYVDYLNKEIDNTPFEELNDRKIKYFNTFKDNLLLGIAYYKTALPNMADNSNWSSELDLFSSKIDAVQIPKLVAVN